MKRYFVTATRPDGKYGPMHYHDIPAGHVVVLEEGEPDPSWQELPHVLDPGTKMHPEHAAALAHLGVTPADSTYALAKKLAAINSKFHP